MKTCSEMIFKTCEVENISELQKYICIIKISVLTKLKQFLSYTNFKSNPVNVTKY